MPEHKLHAAVVTDCRKYTSSHHRDKYKFAHSHHTLQGALNPTHKVKTAIYQPCDTGQQIADSQHNQHVHATCRAHQHCQIGHHFPPRRNYSGALNSHCTAADKQVHRTHHNSNRQHHLQIESELVAQPATLRLRSYNRRIADKRQVVAKERAANHRRHNHRHGHLRALSHT